MTQRFSFAAAMVAVLFLSACVSVRGQSAEEFTLQQRNATGTLFTKHNWTWTNGTLLWRDESGVVGPLGLGDLTVEDGALVLPGGGGNVAADAIWDAKGDLAAGTGANTGARLAVGTNGQVLVADSSQTTGLRWADAGSGTVTSVSGSGGTTGLTLTGGAITTTGTLTLGGTLNLASGGTGASLSDPNNDRGLFWDDSAGALTWLTYGTGLTVSGTTLSVNATTISSGVLSIEYGGTGLTITEPLGGDRVYGYNADTDTWAAMNVGGGIHVNDTPALTLVFTEEGELLAGAGVDQAVVIAAPTEGGLVLTSDMGEEGLMKWAAAGGLGLSDPDADRIVFWDDSESEYAWLSAVPVSLGGTGATSDSAARTNLGLVIGTDVQAYDADLADLADGSLSGSKVGSGISGSNITTGTVDIARLSIASQAEAEAGTSSTTLMTPERTAQAIAELGGGGGGGNVATDTIWNAAGDLAVGSGADTASRLAVPAATGRVLLSDTGETLKLKWSSAAIPDEVFNGASTGGNGSSDSGKLATYNSSGDIGAHEVKVFNTGSSSAVTIGPSYIIITDASGHQLGLSSATLTTDRGLEFPNADGTLLTTDGNGSSLTGLTKSQVGLGSVENTALSTWAGTSNITTLGTIGTGTWQGTAIGATYIDSAITRDSEWDTVAEIETATSANIIVSTEIDTSAELAAIVADKTGSGALAFGPPPPFIIACSDETTAITASTGKVTFRAPFAFTVTGVRASVTTAPTGSTLIVDINEAGSSILSTKLSIDASEKTSTTAASAAVISDSAIADDAEITIDFDQVGSTIAGAGVKVTIYYTR